jgi:hypothetical protein
VADVTLHVHMKAAARIIDLVKRMVTDSPKLSPARKEKVEWQTESNYQQARGGRTERCAGRERLDEVGI